MKKLVSGIYSQPFKHLHNRKLLYFVSNNNLKESNQEQLQNYFPVQDSSVYIGFDPTAESIHLGNYIGLLALTHFRLAGYNPIVVFGGATALIGDPSGRTTDRQQMLKGQVENNLHKFQTQFSYLTKNIDNYISRNSNKIEDLKQTSDIKPYTFVNNYTFYEDLNLINFLRDIGVHFRVNSMISKDSVKQRIGDSNKQGEGMSFTEFTYQIFQGYDFLRLRQDYNCKLQIGGSDQWGNIASGCDLIRRVMNEEAYGATIPLLVNSQGEKFGKSAGNTGAIWCDPTKTEPYQLYQFLLNVTDQEVEDLLLKLTFIPIEEIQQTMTQHNSKPESRIAQKLLAKTLTEIIHGQESVEKVEGSTQSFFSIDFSKLKEMTQDQFLNHFKNTNKVQLKKTEVLDFGTACVKAGLRTTKADARRAMQQNGFQVNVQNLTTERQIQQEDLIHNKYLILKVGKKNFALLEFIE